MSKQDLMDHSLIQYAQGEYQRQGRDFAPALDAAYNNVQGLSVRPAGMDLVQRIYEYLMAELAAKPATTKAGRIIRRIFPFLPALFSLFKKR